MHLTCPHCHNPIEVVAPAGGAGDEVLCPSCGSTFRVDAEATASLRGLAGTRVGRFELVEAVGTGAFGTVYKARDPQLDRTVAIKIPRAGNLGDAEDRDRFLREGRSVARLKHDGIAAVHEVGTVGDVPYLVSDFIDGPSLSDVLTARQLPAREAAALVAAVADALQYAHERGVVHRDVKPSNILFDPEDRPHLVDFGLAKRDAGEITVTQDGQVLGTPAYMSPEQARGEAHKVDGRSDVYSLGVILYRLLAGELPFRGNARMLVHQVLHDEPRPPRKLNDRIPRDLETVCLKAMAKEPSRRYATAADLASDLRRYLTGEPIAARPVGRLERAWRWARRNRTVAALLAALAVAIAAGFAGVTAAYLRAEHHRAVAEERRKDADAQRLLAERNFDEALAAVDAFLTTVGDERLRDIPAMEPVRRDLLASALDFNRKFLDRRRGDPRLEPRVAAAYLRAGRIQTLLGGSDAARGDLEQAMAIYSRLRAARPGDAALAAGLAETLGELGRHAEAVPLWEELLRTDVGDLRYRRGLASCLFWQGTEIHLARRYLDALRSQQRALGLYEGLVHDHPEDTTLRAELGQVLNALGNLFGTMGRPAEALAMYRRAVEATTAVLTTQPRSLTYGTALAAYWENTSLALRNLGRLPEARDAQLRAVEVLRRLARDHPDVRVVWRDLLISLDRLRNLLRDLGRPEEIGPVVRETRSLIDALPTDTAADWYGIAYVRSLNSVLDDPAAASQEEREEARRNADLAVEALRKAVAAGWSNVGHIKTDPDLDPIRGRADFREIVAGLERAIPAERQARLAELDARARQPGITPDEALRDRREALFILGALPDAARARPDIGLSTAANLLAVARLHEAMKQPREAIEALSQVIATCRQVVAVDPGNAEARRLLDAAERFLERTTLLAASAEHAAAGRWPEMRRTLVGYRDALRRRHVAAPGDAELASDLAATEFRLAELDAGKGILAEVADAFERGLALDPDPDYSPSFWLRYAAYALALGDRPRYERACAQIRAAQRDEWKDLGPGLVLMASSYGSSGQDLDSLRAEQLARTSQPMNGWNRSVLYTSLLRSGHCAAADEIAANLTEGWFRVGRLPYCQPISDLKQGRLEAARRGLQAADDLWIDLIHKALDAPIYVHPQESFYWAWPELILMRRDLNEAFGRSNALDETRIGLVAARGYAAVGLTDRARATLRSLRIPDDDPLMAAWFETWRAVVESDLGAWQDADASRARAAARLDRAVAAAEAAADGSTLERCGHLALRMADWPRAAAILRRARALAPDPHHPTWKNLPGSQGFDWTLLAQATLLGGDEAGYRAACVADVARMRDLVGPAPGEPWAVVRSAATSGRSGVDPAWMVEATRGTIQGDGNWIGPYLHGLALHRAGRDEEAARVLRAHLAGPQLYDDQRSLVRLALALAEAGRGDRDAARRLLAEATAQVDRTVSRIPARFARPLPAMADWLDFLLLRREAEALLRDTPELPADPFARGG